MARYIYLEELERRIKENVPTSGDGNTPYEVDLLEWCKDECIRQGYAMPVADVVPRSEVDKARLIGYELGKREVARNIYVALYNEIIDARNSNFEAIKEREIKHNVNRYEDDFCRYCDGKIHALDGIRYFITELIKNYTEVDK